MIFKSKFPSVDPPAELGLSLAKFYWLQLDKFADKVLFVDYESGREWTGKQIKQAAARIAIRLVQNYGFQRGDSVFMLCYNSDYAQILGLAILFAGGYLCQGMPYDPAAEKQTWLSCTAPKWVFAASSIHGELLEIRRALHATNGELYSNFKIIITDDESGAKLPEDPIENFNTLGLHTHLLSVGKQTSDDEDEDASVNSPVLPVEPSSPDAPAYVLLTSGSTDTAGDLWPLDSECVFAGHLPLDHGTGTFSTKLTLAKGMRLIIMNGFQMDTLLEAISRYGITDCLLGSALLHNMMSLPEEQISGRGLKLDSLRNLISVGSRLPSAQTSREFMNRYPKVNVRQCFGMTEFGFVSFVSKQDCRTDDKSVGYLLPNIELKLLDQQTGKEVDQFDTDGELLVRGPTLSPGYLGEAYEQQTKQVFLDDGFYKTGDICHVKADQRIVIRGRKAEVLCFDDGWKVLPQDIEAALMDHPGVQEAVVIGLPHPTLPTCHAARYYLVAKPDWAGKLTEHHIREFADKNLSEAKRPLGGVRILDEMPRISVGKPDRMALRRMDGLASS